MSAKFCAAVDTVFETYKILAAYFSKYKHAVFVWIIVMPNAHGSLDVMWLLIKVCGDLLQKYL